MDQDATWYGGRPRPRPHCARWDPTPPARKGAQSPNFLAHVYCAQTAEWIKMPLGVEVGLDPSDIVLDRDPAPASPERGQSPPPIFGPCLLWPNGCMDQDATWYEGNPRPGNIVLDADPSPAPCLLWPDSWMDQDANWYEGRPQPRPHCVTWGPNSPLQKGAQSQNFRPMSIVAKRSPISATAENLSIYFMCINVVYTHASV